MATVVAWHTFAVDSITSDRKATAAMDDDRYSAEGMGGHNMIPDSSLSTGEMDLISRCCLEKVNRHCLQRTYGR